MTKKGPVIIYRMGVPLPYILCTPPPTFRIQLITGPQELKEIVGGDNENSNKKHANCLKSHQV